MKPRTMPAEQVRTINETIEAGNRTIAVIMARPGDTVEAHLIAARAVANIVSETATAVAAIAAGAYA